MEMSQYANRTKCKKVMQDYKICANFKMFYKYYVSFAVCYICTLSHLHFVAFALSLICILSYLHFALFAFCPICILPSQSCMKEKDLVLTVTVLQT